MNSNIYAKANEIIKSCDAAYLGVIDENGYPHVSTVSTIKPEDIFTAYFATGVNANKTKRLLRDNRASVCYRAGGDNITLVGETEILTDQKTKSKYWLDWFINHFQGGETDPDYCIIKFSTKRASLWIGAESAEFTIDELLTV